MKEKLFEEYFVKATDLSNSSNVQIVFEQEGMPYQLQQKEELDALLTENRLLGISAVPTFVLNDDISITGAQPIDRWTNYLSKTLGLL